ncbi:MAG: right-handed parallel beta-helix repeat-containing protein [Planctomycetota bacterium]
MLDAPDKNSAVTFSDNPNSALAGLTILKAKYGIKCNNSSPRISRCIIQDQKYHGLRCTNSSSPTIVDCNIQNNGPSPGDVGHGVFSDDSHPAIVRCVVTGNDHGVESTSSSSLTVANSSVADNNAVTDANETDIDGEDRIIDGDSNGTATVDMGADEYYWSAADLNRDYFVNFLDFAVFASAWETSSGEPNYKEICDLADNNAIDYNDLRVFCEDWLWQAGWAQPFGAGLACGMAQGAGSGQGLYSAGPSLQQSVENDQPDIEELIEWLEELWSEDDELSETTSEDEWLKFLDKIKAQP